MPNVEISAPDDPRLSEYRDVLDPDLVRRRGLFVAEGRLVVERVIRDPRYVIRSLLLSEASRRTLEPALRALDDKVPIFVCDARHFREIAGYDVHRGCLALVERPAPPTLDQLVGAARAVVVLEGVANADNVGGVFRNAAAFGVDAVLLDPTTCDPFYRKAIRTSMAATLSVPFARAEDAALWPAALADLRARGFTLIALTPKDPALGLDDLAAAGPLGRFALLVGAEGAGLGASAQAAADYRVRIPIRPEVDSLNLAVATGIALHRLAPSYTRRAPAS